MLAAQLPKPSKGQTTRPVEELLATVTDASNKFGKPSDLRRPASAQAAAKGDGRLTFAAGDILFQQGDAGGDLFFIEDGTVEIFTKKDGENVILSEMQPGEIIGVMTCMTSEARMASARAKTPVVCKKVPHQSIKKVLEALPNWMKIVLKEFTIRLTQMNKMYSDSVLKIKKLEATQISHVYTGAQIAAAFAAFGEYIAVKVDDYKVVVIDDAMQKLEMLLNLKREELDRLFAVIMESGLLRVEIEPDRKRTVTRLDAGQKLAFFAQFVRESKHGSTKKYIKARFTNKETRVLSAIVKLAARLDMDLEKSCKFAVKELEKSMERATGVKFEREALDKGAALKLLELKHEGEDEVVVLKPSQLGRTVACVEAVRRFMQLDMQQRANQATETAA